MTLREAIVAVFKECDEAQYALRVSHLHTRALIDRLELGLSAWEAERDCRLDQIIALARANLYPMLRRGGCGSCSAERWSLQLSPEPGHLIDFNGATLEDVLQEACDKYLPQEAPT